MKSWNLPQSKALREIEERSTDKHFHLVVGVDHAHVLFDARGLCSRRTHSVIMSHSLTCTNVLHYVVSQLTPTAAFRSFYPENLSKVSNEMYFERTEP